ncbi:MAG: hypothetical protein HYS13_18840 [Planctomycetia bacterium]|nr:hypothetical protein [Planctomycetia bacterium]
MDQDTVVTEQTESGKQLIAALNAEGFEVRVAFWAKPTDEGKWFLYLASPIVDAEGPAAAYRRVHRVLKKTPGLWIDPLEVRVVGLNDSLAEAVLEKTRPTVPASPYAVQNATPFRGMTNLGEATLGGISIDGARIYPPSQSGAS